MARTYVVVLSVTRFRSVHREYLRQPRTVTTPQATEADCALPTKKSAKKISFFTLRFVMGSSSLGSIIEWSVRCGGVSFLLAPRTPITDVSSCNKRNFCSRSRLELLSKLDGLDHLSPSILGTGSSTAELQFRLSRDTRALKEQTFDTV